VNWQDTGTCEEGAAVANGKIWKNVQREKLLQILCFQHQVLNFLFSQASDIAILT
jgi:hypothetical protein